MNIIAIDCGASFVKGALFVDGIMEKNISRHAPKVHGDGDISNPEQIISLIKEVQIMLKELSEGLIEAGLVICNEMHGFLLADNTGNPITDYISWQKEYGSIKIDGRTVLNRLSEESLREDIINSGMPLRAGLPNVNLFYLCMNGYIDNIKGDVYFYTLGDYLIRYISGKQPMCHPTNAAATGLYDLRKNSWNDKLCNTVSMNRNVIFPTVGKTGCKFELYGTSFYVLPALGDQQAALYGADFVGDNDLSFNLGTGSQVSIIIDSPDCSSDYQVRPYVDGRYIKTLPHIPSGRALNVYIRFLKEIAEKCGAVIDEDRLWEIVIENAGNMSSSEIRCDLSFFSNAITDHVTGFISNIEEYGLTIGNLFYAIFNQMVDNYIYASDIILDGDDREINRIVFSGGVARRIDMIREGIMRHYCNAEEYLSNDDTLCGLRRYYEREVTE